jgi:hypothetical protein
MSRRDDVAATTAFTVADSWRASANECERDAETLDGMAAAKRKSAETYRRMADAWEAERAAK